MSYKLMYQSNFNVNRAELDEWYVLCQESTNWRGKPKLHIVYRYYPDNFKIPVKGDLAWAKKIAKHYNIKVPMKPNNPKGLKKT